MNEIPTWIDPEAWADFVEMRKAMKSRAPWTPGAQKLILRELAKMLDQGFDPNESLRQSTINAWRGVFPAKRQQRAVNAESFRERDDRAAAERVAAATGGLVARPMVEYPHSGMFDEVPYVRRIA